MQMLSWGPAGEVLGSGGTIILPGKHRDEMERSEETKQGM
jgi:hypothetical protein